MYLIKNFQKGGSMGEELKFVTSDEGLRKKDAKKILRFLKKWLNFKTFLG